MREFSFEMPFKFMNLKQKFKLILDCIFNKPYRIFCIDDGKPILPDTLLKINIITDSRLPPDSFVMINPIDGSHSVVVVKNLEKEPNNQNPYDGSEPRFGG